MISSLITLLSVFIVMLFLAVILSITMDKNDIKLKNAREHALAKKLEVDCTDFAVLTFIKSGAFLGSIKQYDSEKSGKSIKYYSGENAVWLIVLEAGCYEVLFKGKTNKIIFVKKVERNELLV